MGTVHQPIWHETRALRSVRKVLEQYGHQEWASDCARQLACALTLGLQPTVSKAHEIVTRVNGGAPGDRYVIPREATALALAAWKVNGGGV